MSHACNSPSHARSCAAPSAFTLIELLVVISIISLLIALLMPALGKAREQSRAIQCMSTLRGIGQAFNMYTFNHKDSFMQGYSESHSQGTAQSPLYNPARSYAYPLVYDGLLPQSSKVFHCPSRTSRSRIIGGKSVGEWWDNDNLVQILHKTSPDSDHQDVWQTVDYGANISLVTRWNGSATNYHRGPRKLYELAPNRIVAAESVASASVTYGGARVGGLDNSGSFAYTAHNTSSNILNLDGSVFSATGGTHTLADGSYSLYRGAGGLGIYSQNPNRWTYNGKPRISGEPTAPWGW